MPTQVDELLTIQEVASWLKIPVATLYGWRHRGQGPVGVKIGQAVRYRRKDVEAWLVANEDQKAAAAV